MTRMKLFWATTEDHDEDWFIVASSTRKAATLHEEMEGYNPGEATVLEVMDIPEEVPAEPGWPPEDLLIALGAKFLHSDEPRVVEINGKKFCEGFLSATLNERIDDIFEARGDGRLNETKKSPLQ